MSEKETAGTPTLAAQAKRRIRTCMHLFHNAEDNWGVEMASEHMDNMNPEHTLLDWIDDGIDALEREVAALTTQRDELQKRIGYTAVPVAEGGANIDEAQENAILRAGIQEAVRYLQGSVKDDVIGTATFPEDSAVMKIRRAYVL